MSDLNAFDQERFRQELWLAALKGLAANDFLAQQLAAMHTKSLGELDPQKTLALVAVKVADRIFEYWLDTTNSTTTRSANQGDNTTSDTTGE